MATTVSTAVEHLRSRIVGLHDPVPLLDGRRVPYCNLDNAASTPPLQDAADAVARFLPYYASVHRGTGFKSRLSTEAYDQAHHVVRDFVAADPDTDTVIFVKHTTEALNKIARCLPAAPGRDRSVVLCTQLEHHSNDLPWRAVADVVHVAVTPEGRLDEADFDAQLARHAGRVALVAVAGASNVTGFVQPIHRLAAKAHAAGARIVVDAAQLAPHRPIDMKPPGDPEHLDFVALSAHKLYAPFGSGALIGPAAFFQNAPPSESGGGTVDVVTEDAVHWAGLPDREEAGSPNVVGAVAFAAALRALAAVGMNDVSAHEEALTAYALERLATVPGLTLYGSSFPREVGERVGVIPFNLDGLSHFQVAAVLGYEAGIGVRAGCFCAHPYVVHLLQLAPSEAVAWRDRILAGDRSAMPGMVRISFGCYSNHDDVDALVHALHRIARGDIQGDYRQDRASGEFTPRNYRDDFTTCFALP